jgi:hypothetical protein
MEASIRREDAAAEWLRAEARRIEAESDGFVHEGRLTRVERILWLLAVAIAVLL